jgi:SAM-dependent methyltransferase
MDLRIVTGLCGSGKSHFCQDKLCLSFDDVYYYPDRALLLPQIDLFFRTHKSEPVVYLDAYTPDLINYITNKYEINHVEAYLLYTDIDELYDILTQTNPRDFGRDNYDDVVKGIVEGTTSIEATLSHLDVDVNIDRKWIHRQKGKYTEYDNSDHLFELLHESKKDRLLRFIDNTSGAKDYQSIILDNERIRSGTEQDWVTLDNILQFTQFENKVVMDTGCFNGYFSFKAAELGASKVMGVDHNPPALEICRRLAYYNNLHVWQGGQLIRDESCQMGIAFYNHILGKDFGVFSLDKTEPGIDLILALNYLHHLMRDHGEDALSRTLDLFFSNTREMVFEVNPAEIPFIEDSAKKHKFTLEHRMDSHRKTGFGDRQILYYRAA